MQKELKYASAIKDMPFMFLDMKRTALLMCEGKSNEEIICLSMEDNIYQLEKDKRRRDVPMKMLKRLSTINKSLLDVVAHGHDSDAKLIAFLAFIKSDRLLFEYMQEVYADKFSIGIMEITDKDYLNFIENEAQNSETVAKWSVKNLAAVRGAIKSTLCEAGLAKREGDILMIQRPIIDRSLSRLLAEAETDRIYTSAMLMEV